MIPTSTRLVLTAAVGKLFAAQPKQTSLTFSTANGKAVERQALGRTRRRQVLRRTGLELRCKRNALPTRFQLHLI